METGVNIREEKDIQIKGNGITEEERRELHDLIRKFSRRRRKNGQCRIEYGEGGENFMETGVNIREEIKRVMEQNNVSYAEMMDELSMLGRELAEDGAKYMSDVEYRKYQEFEKAGNERLELAMVGASWTHAFAEGIQTVKAMFDGVDFSKPFRVTVDYDPEQPRTIVKKYLTKEAHESYSAAMLEKMKD